MAVSKISEVAWLRVAVAFSLACAVMSCDKSPTDSHAPAATVDVTSSQQFVRVFETAQLKATARNESGVALSPEPTTWTTSDSTVAIITASGTLTGLAPGSVTVTAQTAGKSGTIQITVEHTAASIVLSAPGDVLPGDTLQLTAAAKDSAGSVVHRPVIVWSTVPSDFYHTYQPATVDSTGRVTAKTAGVVRVTAKSGAATDMINVYVNSPVTSLTSDTDSIHVSPGSAWRVSLTAHDSAGNYIGSIRAYSFSSSDSSVAIPDPPSYDERGDPVMIVRAIGPGHATISSSVPGTGVLTRVTVGAPKFIQISGDAVTDASLTCGLTATGDVWCWGNTSYVGIPTWTIRSGGAFQYGDPAAITAPAFLAGGLGFTQISADFEHVCGVNTSGTAYCLGSVGVGNPAIIQGDYTNAQRLPVSGGLTFKSVGTGLYYTCGLTTAGAAYCWGVGFDSTVPGDLVNPNGVLGTGTLDPSLVPAPVTGGHVFKSLSTGGYNVCGITIDNQGYCWGRNIYGQLGTGTIDTLPHPSPEPIIGGLSFASISIDMFGEAACGVTTSGQLYCWGAGYTASAGPVLVSSDQRFTSLSANYAESCALTASGAAYCWSAGGTPKAISGGLAFTSVVASYPDHVCGLTVDDVVYCWTSAAPTPVRLVGQAP